MLEYSFCAASRDAHAKASFCKKAEMALHTGPAGRVNALNPAELSLATLAACMLKNPERLGAAVFPIPRR